MMVSHSIRTSSKWAAIQKRSSQKPKKLYNKSLQGIASIFTLFQKREQQRQMISAVANTLADGSIGLIEAATGTGKSLSYLIPSLVVAINRDKRLVVSTATTALQDQLAAKDIPLVSKVMIAIGMGPLKCAVAKGRERYVCPLRLDALTTQSSLLEESQTNKQFGEIADLWDGGLWDGLRDTLPSQVNPEIWAKINNNSNVCTASSCPAYKECPYYANQKLINDAHIIIANHDYILSCVSNGATKSPVVQFDDCMYVFDEAHHLVDKAIASFSTKLKISKVPASEILKAASGVGAKSMALEVALSGMQGVMSAIIQNLPIIAGNCDLYRFLHGDIPSILNSLILELGQSAKASSDLIADGITKSTKASKKPGFQNFSRLTPELGLGTFLRSPSNAMKLRQRT